MAKSGVKINRANAQRNQPLENQLYGANSVLLKPMPAFTRISLRVGSGQIAAVNKVLSMSLPSKPKTSQKKANRTAMWLGPDEWLILDETSSNLSDLPSKLTSQLGSAVDISHRNTAINVSGINAVDALNAGCPQELSLEKFPVGTCSRTVLGKSEIILLRLAPDEFHVECWRSFSDYVWKFLVDAAKTL